MWPVDVEEFEAQVRLFKALPVKTQERILSHALARMPKREKTVEDNAKEGIYDKMGFCLSSVVEGARRIREKYPNLELVEYYRPGSDSESESEYEYAYES